MRVVGQELAVLAGARLGLVGVADEVDPLGLLGDEGPLEAGREPGAAAAAQVRLLHLVHDGGGLEPERLVEGLVAAVAAVRLERGGVGRPPALREDERVAHLSPPTISSTFLTSIRSIISSSSSSIAGAVPQEPRHSTSRSVIRPSGVVPPFPTPSFALRCSKIRSAPVRQHDTFVQISTRCRPSGFVWNIT